MRTLLLLLVALNLGASALACAPRQSKTHYTRWAEETEKRKEEEAKEEAAKQKATADQKVQPAPAPKSTTPPPPDYSSLPPGDTPDITGTATRSRVIAPAEETKEEDVIY